MSVDSIVPGPGAARDIAKRSANSRWVAQLWTVTDWCSISARREAPPPIESSDSGMKTSASASNVLKSSGTVDAPSQPRQADADWSETEDDGDHRPTQHADAQHGHNRYREGAGVRSAERREL